MIPCDVPLGWISRKYFSVIRNDWLIFWKYTENGFINRPSWEHWKAVIDIWTTFIRPISECAAHPGNHLPQTLKQSNQKGYALCTKRRPLSACYPDEQLQRQPPTERVLMGKFANSIAPSTGHDIFCLSISLGNTSSKALMLESVM